MAAGARARQRRTRRLRLDAHVRQPAAADPAQREHVADLQGDRRTRGGAVGDLPVAHRAGQVDVDRTATVRRRLALTCADPLGDLTPERAGDLLTPYGTELRPYMGVVYDDGTVEVCALGVFRISQVSIVDDSGTGTASGGGTSTGSSSIRQTGHPGGLTIDIEAYDKSRTVSRDKFTAPYTIAEGTNVITAIQHTRARLANFKHVFTYRF